MTIARWNPPVAPTRQEQFLLKRLGRCGSAGRVEDTYNLLAHAARNVVRCAAGLLGRPVDTVCREAGIPVLLGSSVKAALDIDWSDPAEKAAAITTLVRQLDALQAWVARRLPEELAKPPLQAHLDTLVQIRAQDLEPDPAAGGVRLRQGVAEDRRIAVTDKEMRHGRKSKSKRFNGFKRHIAADVDRGLILACALTPANRPEDEAIPALQTDLARHALTVDQLVIDRGYINSTLVDDVLRRRGTIVCKPWQAHNGRVFPKSAFTLNLRDRTITCPQRASPTRVTFGTTVEFDPDICDHCPLRAQCTTAEFGHGRTVAIAENEPLQHRLRKQLQTSAGRAALRERTMIEHKLAHISQRQGNHARYIGVRKNVFDLRRASAIQNLETLHRAEMEGRKAAYDGTFKPFGILGNARCRPDLWFSQVPPSRRMGFIPGADGAGASSPPRSPVLAAWIPVPTWRARPRRLVERSSPGNICHASIELAGCA